MKESLIFLDIDGVLNGHKFLREAKTCNIDARCIYELNRIIRRTGAKVVLSSAWRYMIHGKAMTLSGFAYMLRTHGFIGINNLIGLTCPDELCHECVGKHRKGRGKWDGRDFACGSCGAKQDRGGQIALWLRQNRAAAGRYVVIDDCDMGISRRRMPLVLTDPKRGLTRATADKAIRILVAAPPPPRPACRGKGGAS